VAFMKKIKAFPHNGVIKCMILRRLDGHTTGPLRVAPAERFGLARNPSLSGLGPPP